jgi:membrane protein required for colicin V production
MAIDIIFLLCAGSGFFYGYNRGIIETVLTAFAYLFGLLAAFKLAPTVSSILTSIFNNDSGLMLIAGFALTFIGVILLIRLIINAMEGVLEVAHINIINQFAGGVLMAAFTTLIYATLLWFTVSAGLVEDRSKQQSFSYAFLKDYPTRAKKVGEAVLPVFRHFFDEAYELLDKIKKNGGVEKSESEPNIIDLPDDESTPVEKPKPKRKTIDDDELY